MKTTVIIVVSLLLLLVGVYFILPEDQQNKISRSAVSYLDGNYKVTYAVSDHIKTWTVIDGKVTSEHSKGYYYFWAKNESGKKVYIQTPVERTYIEQF